MSKELSRKEVQEEFLGQIRAYVNYWHHNEPDKRRALEGFAHSILGIIDGVTNLPAFILAPCPHPDDKDFRIEEGEDYYPENDENAINCDISGDLHERFYHPNP